MRTHLLIASLALTAALGTHCGAASDSNGPPGSGPDAASDAGSMGNDSASMQGGDANGKSDAPAVDSGSGGHDAATLADSSGGGPGDASEAGTTRDAAGDVATPPADAGTYLPCPTTGACQILPLGDSITFGIQYAGAYRVELFQDAVNDHKNITFVGDPTLANGPTTVAGMPFPRNNQGHSGWTIDQIAGIVPMPALQPLPQIILLHIGTNDIYSTTQPVAQAPQRLGALIDKIIAGAPDALLVVAQITPLKNFDPQVMTYNAAVPAVVQMRAAAGKHILLVDMHTGFNIGTMLSSDGVHPNQMGYNFMGDVWYAAIKSVLP
jgi:lysophospholipase L1-like esterase